MTTGPMATFVVEYPCELHCRIEVDLDRAHLRFTHRQMLQSAHAEHKKAHQPKAEPAPIYDGLAATFRSPGGS